MNPWTVVHSIVPTTLETDNEMGGLDRLFRLERRKIVPQLAPAIGLPNLASGGVQGSEPAASPAVGIDAEDVAQIEDLAILLRGVADDRRLAGNVDTRHHVADRMPPPVLPALIDERLIGLISAMDEEMRRRFVKVSPGADVVDVLVGNRVHFSTGIAIRLDRLSSAAEKPIIGLRLAVEIVEHHLFVIAAERDDAALLAERQQLIDHLATFGTAIDAVAKRDYRIVGLWLNGFDESAQRLPTTVDITDSYHARGHGAEMQKVFGVDFLIVVSCGDRRNGGMGRLRAVIAGHCGSRFGETRPRAFVDTGRYSDTINGTVKVAFTHAIGV